MNKIIYWDSVEGCQKEREATPEELIEIEALKNPVLTVKDFDNALTTYFDKTAQSRKYDNRITCALRAGYTGPFQSEGNAFAIWMDTCNALAYRILAEVQAGTRPAPKTIPEFIALFPEIVWPS